MAVRFLFGRAGSGKTYCCLQAIREQLLADPINGPAQILFTPEQAAVQAERLLLSHEGLVGASRYYTMSFRRLQQMVLADTGFADREMAGPLGRQMILQYLLIRNRKDLQTLARVADRPGTAGKVAANIAEFMQEGILPQHLQSIAEQIGRPGDVPSSAGQLPVRSCSCPVLVPRSVTRKAALRGQLSALMVAAGHRPARQVARSGSALRCLRQMAGGTGQADPAGLLALTADRLTQCGWLRGEYLGRWFRQFLGTADPLQLCGAVAGRRQRRDRPAGRPLIRWLANSRLNRMTCSIARGRQLAAAGVPRSER